MSPSEDERPLAGGRSTRVVRVGDTVRRETGPWTPTIHAYLRHLRSAGFSGAPEVLGSDQHGREILRFIPGDTMGDRLDPAEPKTELAVVRAWPAAIRSDRALAEVGRLYRALHDAARSFHPSAPVWREYELPMHNDEIVCHGDPGPWNVVYREGIPVALIDWDGAHPERPIIELAGIAWSFVPLGPDEHLHASGFVAPLRRGERLRILTDAYGLANEDGFMAALGEARQLWLMKLRYWQPLRSQAAAALLRSAACDLEWLSVTAEDLAAHLA